MLYFLLASSLSGWELLIYIIAYILVMMLALVLHEFSHGFTAYKCGDDTARLSGRLSLNPFNHIDIFGLMSFLFIGFGWAKPVPVNSLKFRNYKRGQRLVSLSGVVTNFVLAFIFSGLAFFFATPLVNNSNLFLNFIGYFLIFGFYINISYAIFNLLPIYPLDGFNFLKSFLRPDNKYVSFMERYGSIILIIFIVTSAFNYVYNYFLYGIEFLLYGFWGLF